MKSAFFSTRFCFAVGVGGNELTVCIIAYYEGRSVLPQKKAVALLIMRFDLEENCG